MLDRERSRFEREIAELTALTVRDVMNDHPLTIEPDASFEEAVGLFRDHHRVNPIPVVDTENRVVGVISRFDVLKPLFSI